jgi:hypothetical protein
VALIAASSNNCIFRILARCFYKEKEGVPSQSQDKSQDESQNKSHRTRGQDVTVLLWQESFKKQCILARVVKENKV